MISHTRYYVIDNGSVRSIVDGNSGDIVDDENLALLAGETGADYVARMLRQTQRCAALNREDFELLRSFGGLFAASAVCSSKPSSKSREVR